jgi:ABC-2 type transport system permease protein
LSKIYAILKREYIIRVKTKGFVVGTLLFPLFVVSVGFLPVIFSKVNIEEQKSIYVLDHTYQVCNPLAETLEKSKQDKKGNNLYQVRCLPITGRDVETILDELNPQLLENEIDALIIIPADIFTTNTFDIYSKNISNFTFINMLENTVTRTVNNLRILDSGLDPETVNDLTTFVNAKTYKIALTGAEEASGLTIFQLNYIFVFALYMALILYGSFVMRSVIEDKNSRVVEIIVSSVKPLHYMLGKILGIGSAGLTQFFVWIALMFIGTNYGIFLVQKIASNGNEMSLPTINPMIYVAFVLFFILGYFLYSTLYAALGAMVNSDSEAQNLQWPVMILIIISFFLMFPVLESPNSPLATVASVIPFLAPILMFLRISLEAASTTEIISSVCLLIITILFLIWITGRIFRVGILMYGKRPSLPEVIKWIRYS